MKRILIASIVFSSLLSACQPSRRWRRQSSHRRLHVADGLHGQLRHLVGKRHQDGRRRSQCAGGINGKQIELLVQDDRSDASEAATIVTKFVTQDQVHAILGEVASSRSIAAAPIAQNAKIPMLTPSVDQSGSDQERRLHLPQLLHRSGAGRGDRAVCARNAERETRGDHG